MIFLMDPEFWARVFGIIIIDLTLAGDNALVIALAVRTLPKRQQLLGRIWGTLGAVGLRLAFITIATFLLRIPLLQLAGGVALLWIAFKLVHKETGAEGHVREGGSLREAVWIIIVADAIMSLDNVLAVAAAAHGDLRLVVFGIALSLPIVVWGSGLLATLMNRFVWVIWLGGGILGYVAGEMILKDHGLARWIDHSTPGPALREREGHPVSGAHQSPRQPSSPRRRHERGAGGDPGDVPARDGEAADPEGRTDRTGARGRPRGRSGEPLRPPPDRPSRGRRRGLRHGRDLVREGSDPRDLELRLQPAPDQRARHDVDPPDDRQASVGVPADRRGSERALAARAGDRRASGDRAWCAGDRLDRRGRARPPGRAARPAPPAGRGPDPR